MSTEPDPTARLTRAFEAIPALAQVRDAAGDTPVFLVGGAVRDILLERPLKDLKNLDLVVEGDVAGLTERLGGGLTHDRFATAALEVDGMGVDLATARTETYAHPGALPEVSPASLSDDLVRRDFTLNAMAVPLAGTVELIDPHAGLPDLKARSLRVLHQRSFIDDPTRAFRAARYAARLGLTLEPETERLLRATDVSTISEDRVQAELRRLAAEAAPRAAFEQAAEWGLIELPGGGELLERVSDVMADANWQTIAPREDSLLAAVSGPTAAASELAAATPERASEGVALTVGRSGEELVVARAMGAEWLDRYVADWRAVQLEIDGADLMAAGIPEGPAIGRGLGAALAGKLDGELAGREQELEAALRAAREGR